MCLLWYHAATCFNFLLIYLDAANNVLLQSRSEINQDTSLKENTFIFRFVFCSNIRHQHIAVIVVIFLSILLYLQGIRLVSKAGFLLVFFAE